MTILGSHTVAEVKELITNTDYDISQVLAAYHAFLPRWANTDQRAGWEADWKQFFSRYSDARAWAKAKIIATTISSPLVGPTVMPAEDAWQSILHAISKDYPLYTKGDFPDLTKRLQAAGANITFPNRPGYTAIDLDLTGLKAADAATKVIPPAAQPQNWKYLIMGAGVVGAAYVYNTVRK
jgi:hypothetical protein